MTFWDGMKKWFILHLLLGYVFFASGLIVCALMLLTYIAVWPFNKDLYRKICHHLGYMHWCQMTFLGNWWAGSEITLVLEDPSVAKYFGKEHSIAVTNHKYDIDWLMCWMLAERYKLLGGSKVYGKAPLKFVPLIGWAWVFCECIFLKREWDKDKETLKRDLSHLVEYPEDYWVTVLLFCEGTRFTKEKHELSNAIARKKGIPELKHHLLPRAKGFTLSMQGVKGKIPAVYDITVGFSKDGAEPTLMNILQGNKTKAEMFLRRIPTEDIPTEDDKCAEWLHQLYREKDEIMEDFVQHGTFTKGIRTKPPRRMLDLCVFISWAAALSVPLAYYLIQMFMFGSLNIQIAFLVFVALVSIGVKMIIDVTVIKKGSDYGSKPKDLINKNNNGTKKSD